jgi:hypothetical protein
MAAHKNITTTHGLTLATGAVADDVEKSVSVEILEVTSQTSGEVVRVDCVNMATETVTISGDGPGDKTKVAAGTIATPSDLKEIRVENNESPNGRLNFSLTAESNVSFTDPASTVAAVGAEPTIADLEIVSVEYSIAESVRLAAEVRNSVLIGTDGTPAARCHIEARHPFTVNGRGDLPTGVAAGVGGVAFVGGNTGKVIVPNLTTGEKRGDWNRWGTDGTQLKAAA